MSRPTLAPSPGDTAAAGTDGITLVVYAPLGNDPALSTYPDGQSTSLALHPAYRSALGVAEQGVNVVALIDLADEDTVLLEAPASAHADAINARSWWKQDMASPRTLAALLKHAHARFPGTAMVLALEGHGMGYLPEIDRRALAVPTPPTLPAADDHAAGWHLRRDGSVAPLLADPGGSPVLPIVVPDMPGGSPVLPGGAPVLPAQPMPMSTWGLGHALNMAQQAGVPRLAVLYLDNCFNMAIEVLHTVAPYADYAAGYPNYNFYTAGQSWPAIFKQARLHGPLTSQALARALVEGNREALKAKGHHPTTAGVVQLARMAGIVERLDALTDALLAELNGHADTHPKRQRVVNAIRRAVINAQQYDTGGADYELQAPDQFTDLMSLAAALQDPALGLDGATTVRAAAALQEALKGIKAYGDRDRPWMVPPTSGIEWDFSSNDLAMSILLPDPDRSGVWDWRSPFYLAVDAENDRPCVQPHVIDFLKITDWVDFIKAYHRDVKLHRLLPAKLPRQPLYNADYTPERHGATPAWAEHRYQRRATPRQPS